MTEKPHSQADWYSPRHVTEQPCPLFPGFYDPLKNMGALEPLSSSHGLVLFGAGGLSPSSRQSPRTPVAGWKMLKSPRLRGAQGYVKGLGTACV